MRHYQSLAYPALLSLRRPFKKRANNPKELTSQHDASILQYMCIMCIHTRPKANTVGPLTSSRWGTSACPMASLSQLLHCHARRSSDPADSKWHWDMARVWLTILQEEESVFFLPGFITSIIYICGSAAVKSISRGQCRTVNYHPLLLTLSCVRRHKPLARFYGEWGKGSQFWAFKKNNL